MSARRRRRRRNPEISPGSFALGFLTPTLAVGALALLVIGGATAVWAAKG